MSEFHVGKEPLAELTKYEWLVTNGIGGFASGTVSGVLTRQYHGLLIAALNPPVERMNLAAKFDPWVRHNGKTYALFANRWKAAENPVEPQNGMEALRKFYLDGSIPTWEFQLGESILLQQIWMEQGENTTYQRFQYAQGEGEMSFTLKGMLSYTDFHQTNKAGGNYKVAEVDHGVKVIAGENAIPYFILSTKANPRILENIWLPGFYLAVEDYRGLDALADYYNGVDFRATLKPGESMTIVVSTQEGPDLDGDSAYQRRKWREKDLLRIGKIQNAPEKIRQLVLAADQFIVRRKVEEKQGHSVVAGYHWFSDWGRDTMIALPGLTLATGRYDVAESILRTFAKYVDRGMLPNRFPDLGEDPEYNTIDATLWYFEAIYQYFLQMRRLDNDRAVNLLQELYPVLQEIIAWHERGTRYNIHVDPADHLVYGGEEGVQLTWMDAKVGEFVVTPRIGKPVEINALWYNALSIMAEIAGLLEIEDIFTAKALTTKRSFQRFWNEEKRYCYDVLDGPNGNEDTLRPNQVIGAGLSFSPFSFSQTEAILSACEKDLLTLYGLRSLDPANPDYIGKYGGSRLARDKAYHQGTVWGWLIGPYMIAKMRLTSDKALVQAILDQYLHTMDVHGIGSISEIFDGNAPFSPRGCIAQAWSVAAGLQVWDLLNSQF